LVTGCPQLLLTICEGLAAACNGLAISLWAMFRQVAAVYATADYWKMNITILADQTMLSAQLAS
jgi:hypothetical protein